MKEVIEKFYTAFSNLDAEAMASYYHPDIIFEDPGFGVLKENKPGNMWRMLCENQKGKGMRIEFSQVTDHSAHWEAYYTFSRTGRKVHNIIDAKFEFKDGLIIKHTDHFNLHRWAGQALGLKGRLLGWTGFFKKKLHTQTGNLLSKFESRL